MPASAPQSAPLPSGSRKQTWFWIILVAVAVVVAGAVIYFISLPEEAVSPTTTAPAAPAENLSQIEAELQGVDLEGLDTELDEIEQELQGL